MAPPRGAVNYKSTPSLSSSEDNNEKPPLIQESSLSRRKYFICFSFLLLTAACGLLYQYSLNTEFTISTKPEYCKSYYPRTNINHPENPNHTKCFRNDLFSIQIAFALPLFYVALKGIKSWYITQTVHALKTPEERLFGYLKDNDDIATINFAFQVWDFIFSWFVPEYCTVVMMCHHALSALVCFYSIHWQFLHYYGIYFLGLTEISSMFLLFIDFSKYFPPIPSSPLDQIVSISQVCFVITFFYYRVYKWNVVSYQLWKDVYAVTVKSNVAQRYRPNKVYVLYVYLVCNVLLGGLQLMWWFLEIMPLVIKSVRGG